MQDPDPMLPLICELDSALIKTDLRSEHLVHRTKAILQRIFSSEFDLKQLRLELNEHEIVGPVLPVNEEVFNFLQSRKKAGQPLILCTSLPPETTTALLTDLNIFDQIIESCDSSELRSRFGDFDYIGNSKTQSSIWESASSRFVVEATDKTSAVLRKNNLQVTKSFSTVQTGAKAVYKSLRVYQWMKNLLVFVPIITAQQMHNTTSLLNAAIMFLCFSLVASFGYIVNDILDLQSDRAHPVKFKRPFASGALSVTQGALISTLLLVLAAIGCSLLPASAGIALGCYLLLTVCYSLYLKTKLMIDVVALGGLFTLRVIGGAEAIETDLSFYLLSFSIFIFSSLGMVKRFAELHNLQRRNKLAAQGRGYRVEDMAPVRIIGISLGYMSVFIMGQYINSPVVTQYYDNPKLIWLLFPLLTFWLGRLWILANRGEVNEDPLIFAVKDRTSLLVVAVSALILFIAN